VIMAREWLIDDLLPMGHKGQLTSPEGSFKTIFSSYISVCIAGGFPVLGYKVKQGEVLIVDEETPTVDLGSYLNRFACGFGLKGYRELPITVLSMKGFRLGRRTELAKLVGLVKVIQPVFISFDSLIALLPSGRQRIAENDSNVGETIRDDLNAVLNTSNCSALLLTHTKKSVVDLDIEELRYADMQSLVRGHGSIVGEGCDTGFILKKLSENPKPTKFAIITKARRQAIPASTEPIFVEMVEEKGYGKGDAKLKVISKDAILPSEQAIEIFPYFLDKNRHTASQIRKHFAFFSRKDCKKGIDELLEHKCIKNVESQVYHLNVKYKRDCHQEYWSELLKK